MSSKGFTIVNYSHTGITVSSLSKSLEFWHGLLGAQIKYRNHIESTPESNTVGVPGAVMDIALVTLPDGNTIELLEYSRPDDRQIFKPRPCDIGNVHVALEVEGAGSLITQATELGWSAASNQVKIKRGDGSSWAVSYLRGPDGETLELLECLDGSGGRLS